MVWPLADDEMGIMLCTNRHILHSQIIILFMSIIIMYHHELI